MSPDLKVLEGTARTLLAEAVDGWLKELHAAGRRVSTVQSSYGYPLRSLCLPFCDRRGVSEVAQVTNGLLADFTIHLCDERGPKGQLSEASIHAYLRPINQFPQVGARAGARRRRPGEPAEAGAENPGHAEPGRDPAHRGRMQGGALQARGASPGRHWAAGRALRAAHGRSDQPGPRALPPRSERQGRERAPGPASPATRPAAQVRPARPPSRPGQTHWPRDRWRLGGTP